MNKASVILIGNGGHASVLREILTLNAIDLVGVVDEVNGTDDPLYIGNDEAFLRRASDFSKCMLVNGVGSIKSTSLRRGIYKRYKEAGFQFMTLIHPSAVISKGAVIKEGAHVMAGCVLQTGSEICENVIINTRSSLDHDCIIGKHSHIAPGCTLSGGVHVGENCHIGTGSIFIQSVEIGDNILVRAGSVVIKNIDANQKVSGVLTDREK